MSFIPTSGKLSYVNNNKKFYKICSRLIINFSNKNLAGLLRLRVEGIIGNLLLRNESYAISSVATHVFSFKSNKRVKRFYKVLVGDINTWRLMSTEFRTKDNQMRNATLNTIPNYANKDDYFITKKIYFTECKKAVAKQLNHLGDNDITILNPFALGDFSQQWMQRYSYMGSKAIDFIIIEGITYKPTVMKISSRWLHNTDSNNIIFELSSLMRAMEQHPKLLVRIFTIREDAFSPFKVVGLEVEEGNYQLCINIDDFNLLDNVPPPEYNADYFIDLFE
jgi:hypothetical protein